jgi:transcriptional regulator with XRE-family HTH domain
VAETDPNKPFLEHLGRRIKDLRRERGITQEKLAAAVKRSRSYLTILEAGSKTASLSTLIRIARALSVTPAELFLDPNDIPATSRAIVDRITSRLLRAERSPAELAKLEKLIITFLGK